MKRLLTALHKIIAIDPDNPIVLKKSGTVLNLLRSVDEEMAVTLADVYYLKRAKEKEIFAKGLNFGHLYKNKNSFYRIELRNNVLFFVGTEAEILGRIREKVDIMKSAEEKEKKV